MAEYRHSAHAVFDLKYHVIWYTNYRYKILRGRVLGLLFTTCAEPPFAISAEPALPNM